MFRYFLTSKIVAPKLKVKSDKEEQTCYDAENECLIIGADFDSDDCGFMRHLRESHKFAEAYNYSLKLWTILHEIGHYHTIDFAEDDLTARAICAMIPRDEAANNPTLQDIYFNIENEWEATEWAVEWIQTHKFLAKILNWLVK